MRGERNWYVAKFVPGGFTRQGLLDMLAHSKLVTKVWGPRWTPSRKYIELEITTVCNLSCNDCDRMVATAASKERMSVEQVRGFVEESLDAGHAWERVRVLGGEPTLHPELDAILEQLNRLREAFGTQIQIATNGHGNRVAAKLAALPEWVSVDNTEKTGSLQPSFNATAVAPVDLPVLRRWLDFSNGCWITELCGMALTPHGYYPCGASGTIDRVLGRDSGRKRLPEAHDEMRDLLESSCSLCGHCLAGVVRQIGPKELTATSPFWDRALTRYRKEGQPPMTRVYGC